MDSPGETSVAHPPRKLLDINTHERDTNKKREREEVKGQRIGNEVDEKRERKYEKIELARIKISRQAVESLNFVVPISLQPNVI